PLPVVAAAAPAGTLRDQVAAFERQAIRAALDVYGGNWAQAARALGLDASNLHKLARRLQLKA
ncbi:MAG: helix-turn-helix domain-containing protein, partial [Hydrogenophaga sp.]